MGRMVLSKSMLVLSVFQDPSPLVPKMCIAVCLWPWFFIYEKVIDWASKRKKKWNNIKWFSSLIKSIIIKATARLRIQIVWEEKFIDVFACPVLSWDIRSSLSSSGTTLEPVPGYSNNCKPPRIQAQKFLYVLRRQRWVIIKGRGTQHDCHKPEVTT